MKKPATYELIIAQKLQELPVPDMADAIWARIEQQLDLDLPTDDGGSPAPSSPINGWIGGSILGLFLLALILVLYPKKQESPTPSENNTFPTNRIEPRSADPNKVVMGKPTGKQTNIGQSGTTPPVDQPVGNTLSPDSNLLVNPMPAPDIPQVSTVNIAKTSPPQDSVTPKRTRGVTGISDSDYRVVPKGRDSL